MKILKIYFSREKKLYYFDLWNYCDRKGTEKYFSKKLKDNLFIVPPKGEKGSGWYVSREMDYLKRIAINFLKHNSQNNVWNKIKKDATAAWEYLEPYALGKNIKNIQEWKKYQKQLLLFWTAMNSVIWEAIDSTKVDSVIREEFISIRRKSEKYVEKTSELAVGYFEKKFPKHKDISHVLTFDEMVGIVEKKISDKKMKDILKRQNGCFLLNNKIYPDFKKLDFILKKNNLKLEEIKFENISEIKGTIAMKGYAKGIVKNIKNKTEISKIKARDILVTQMTSPDYVPAIRISSALVTDEGGSLCHAAIVSRELKKPCIIGTKNATEILKDGDLVEVDADKGIVRIIK